MDDQFWPLGGAGGLSVHVSLEAKAREGGISREAMERSATK